MNDKLEQLYNLYKQTGIIQSTDFNTFSTADDNQRKKLYELGKQKGLFKTTDYNTFNSAFAPVKKKEKSESDSPSGTGTSSSVTPSKQTPSPSGSSAQKYKTISTSKLQDGSTQEVIKGDAGKGERTYALRKLPNGREVWYEYSSTNVGNGKQEELFEKPITDPSRVSTLNSKFGKKASVKADEDIYTGFPEKEENEYRVAKLQNGNEVWEVRRKGQQDFTTIANKGSINALNNQFGKKVSTSTDAELKRDAQISRQKSSLTDFKEVNKDLIGKEEDEVIKELTSLYGNKGFAFRPYGLLTDWVIVEAKNGKTMKVSLDNVRSSSDSTEAINLRIFLSENQYLNDYIDKEREQAGGAEKKLVDLTQFDFNRQLSRLQGAGSQSEFENAKEINATETATKTLMDKSQEAKDLRKAIVRSEFDTQQRISDLSGLTSNKLSKEELAAIAEANKNSYVERYKINDSYINDIAQSRKDIELEANKLRSEVEAFNEYASSNNLDPKSPEAIEKKLALESKYNSLIEKSKNIDTEVEGINLIKSQNEKNAALYFAYNETRGTVEGGLWNGALKGFFGLLGNDNADAMVNAFGSEFTTKEFTQSEDRSDLTKAAFSVSESLGALAAALVTGGTSAEGTLARKVGEQLPFFAMSYNEIKGEMDSKEFSDIPDWQKEGLAIMYGLGIGYLDKISTNFSVKGKIPDSIAKGLIFRSIAGLEKGATAEAISAAIESNLKKDLAAGVLKIVGNSLVEGTTEGVQSLAGSGLKAAFNSMTGQYEDENGNKVDRFNLNDWGKQALEEAYLGALGGAIMGVPSSLVKGAKNGFKRLDPVQMELNRKVIDDSNMRSMILTDIKTKLMSGEITKAEADEQLQSIKDSSSLFRSVPADLSEEGKAQAFDLMIERSKIEKEIEGKEDNLVVAQKERIKEINLSLQELSTAKAEPTDQVDVQANDQVDGVVEGERAVVSGVEIIYPTEKQKAERTAARSSAEFIDNAAKDLPIEDVDALTEELNGEFGILSAENPLAQPLTDQENNSLTQKAIQWLEAKGYKPIKQLGKYGQGENSMRVPNLSKADAIEFAKEFNQESVAHSDGLIYQDGSMNPRSKKDDDFSLSEYSPESDMVTIVRTPDGLKTISIGYDFASKVPAIGSQSQAVEQNELTLDNYSDVEKSIVTNDKDGRATNIAKASRAVLKSLPSAKIYLHNTTEEYRNAIAKAEGSDREQVDIDENGDQQSNGTYLNGAIHIDMSRADASTVFHEAFHHAVVATEMKTELMREWVDGLKKIVSDKGLIAKLEKFEDRYSEDTDAAKAEEFLAELNAILSEAKTELTTTKLQQFKQLVNSIAKKLGLTAVFKDSDTAQEVLNFMNDMSKNMRQGKEIKATSAVIGISSRKKRMSEPVAGNKLFSKPLKDASVIAERYSEKSGIEYVDPARISKLDESNSKAIASEYDKMKNDPTNPEVRAAYDAMISETIDQYEEIIKDGYVIEVNNNEPYSSSEDMIKDLRDNKRMKIFSTESGFGDDPITDEQRAENPLLQRTRYSDSNGVPLLANDIFRFVHDFFGHAKFGNGFGPVGEENAWRIHSVMYSELARRAVTSETRGQNSWVNFSGVNDAAFKLRDKARELRKQGKVDEANEMVGQVYDQMQFAEQKVGLMPEWVSETGPRKKQKSGKKPLQKAIDKSFAKSTKKVVINERVALRDQIRSEVKAARTAGLDRVRKFRAIAGAVNAMKRNGSITSKQAITIVNKLAKVNLDSPVATQKFIDYASKVFDNADYKQQLSDAFKIQRQIKNKLKNGQASTIAAAKAFASIDPLLVDDFSEYMEYANRVYSAVRSSRTTNSAVELKSAMDIQAISEYTDAMIEVQNEKRKEEILAVYQELADTGVISEDMSLKDIQSVINSLKDPSNKDIQEESIRSFINGRIELLNNDIQFILKNNIDPSGDNLEITPRQRELISKLIKMDPSKLSIKEAIRLVEFMDNFTTNGVVDGIEEVSSIYEGKEGAARIKKEGIVARSLKTLNGKLSGSKTKAYGGAVWAQQMMTFVTLNDMMFKGVRRAGKVLTEMGFYAFSNGANKANNVWNKIVNEYSDTFTKLKPNGEQFNTAKNIYERGMYAFLNRTVSGTEAQQKEELVRKIGLLKESISRLKKKGDLKQQKMADIYQELFDKLGLDENNLTISDIESRIDPINKDAVNWWIDEWGKHYSDLANVSSSVYNTILGKDINYTPDSFSKITSTADNIDQILEDNGGAFAASLNYVYDKKAGALMESKKLSGMDVDRFVDLDFDTVNSRAVKSALVDINTAAATRQIQGFLSSDEWSEIITSKEDRDLYEAKLKSYIFRSRNKMAGSADKDSTLATIERITRTIGLLGTTKALGGVLQSVKQTIPVIINTAINTGETMRILTPFRDKDIHDWIDRSGMAISNRGAESRTNIEAAHNVLEKAFEGSSVGRATEVTWKTVEKANTMWLKVFLANPDVWVARSAFISYYKQDLKRQGIDTSNIDWTNHEMNAEAANYAQHMVDRQQNVSDTNLGGELFTNENFYAKMLKNILFPFASFAINQKSRMYSDIATLTSTDGSYEDKVTAMRSLGGVIVEMLAYQSLGVMIRYAIITAVREALTGYEPDEEEKDKWFANQAKYASRQTIVDLASPAPIADYWVIEAVNKMIEAASNPSDSTIQDAVNVENEARMLKGEDPLDGYKKNEWIANWKKEQIKDKQFLNDSDMSFGTLGIIGDKAGKLLDMIEVANTGVLNYEYAGQKQEKFIMEKDREAVKTMIPYMALYVAGFAPKEVEDASRYVMADTKKMGVSMKKGATYQEIVDYNKGREVDKIQAFLIDKMRGTDDMKASERIIEEIDWIKEKGGLANDKQMDKYIEIYERDGSVGATDMEKIQKLK
jgi:hypothetical protein